MIYLDYNATTLIDDTVRQAMLPYITSCVEHPAVVNVCAWLETQGFHITFLPVDAAGLVSPADLESSLTDQTLQACLLMREAMIEWMEECAAKVAR